MSFYLSPLIPTSGLVRAYPLWNDTVVNDAAITTVADESGNGEDLAPIGTLTAVPVWKTSGPNDRNVIFFDGTDNGLTNGEAIDPLTDVFILAKSTENPFTANRGLVSDQLLNAILESESSGTKFADPGPSILYYKANVAYPAANLQAPMDWAMVQITNKDGGWTTDGFQIGEAFNDPWKGYVGDIFAYTEIKTAAERRSIKCYYDLKFRLWLTDGSTLYFPDPEATGIYWRKFDENPLDWSSVTESHEYQDKGRSFNTFADTPQRVWEIDYTGLTPEEAEVFDAFNDAARRDRTFSLIDKWGVTWTDVRIQSYSRGHDEHKSWSKNVSFTLVKYP